MAYVFVRSLMHHLFVIREIILSLMILLLFVSITAAETLSLSLSDALSIALKENQSIRVYKIAEDISGHDVDFESSIFIPSLQTSYSYNKQNYDRSNLNSYDETAEDNYSVSLGQLNSLGGNSSINFSSTRDSTTYSSGFDAREYNSSVFMKYEQPVLEGFGPEVAELEINKALIDRELASEIYDDMKSNVLFNVYKDYFQLYRISEELRLRREIRKNTEEILDMVSEKVKARKLPVTEFNTIEAALFVQDKLILDLENRKQKQENKLMLSIYEDTKAGVVSDIVLLNSPDYFIQSFKEPDKAEAEMSIADMDIELIKLDKETEKLGKDRIKALNDVKPDLTLSFEFGFDGNDFDERQKSVENIRSSNYRAMVTGTLLFPVINRAANSRLARVNSRIEQVRIQTLNRRNAVNNSVNELFDDFQTIRDKIELDRKIVGISKENLDNEIERLIGEKSTALNTLDYQTDYITAQIGMLRTSIDYIILIGTYYRYVRGIVDFINMLK